MIDWTCGDLPPWLNVSRETSQKLEHLVGFVEKWNPAINLVATGSLPVAWHRHVLDSAQLFALAPPDSKKWVDLGSGAGFPGLVIAIIAAESNPSLAVTLVEADKRKAAFLTQTARELGVAVRVLPQRAEEVLPLSADVLSARALARLTKLCPIIHLHAAPNGVALLLKGAQTEQELAEAAGAWRFDVQTVLSKTDPSGRIVLIKNIRHA